MKISSKKALLEDEPVRTAPYFIQNVLDIIVRHNVLLFEDI